ncbi:MAG: RnfABCDGE type electron transport complex subunit B [Lachnospiraceae bacterium]|nr:RnfABCDGE type electron transport complex subunit B [Lachnospiraceae bacterium]
MSGIVIAMLTVGGVGLVVGIFLSVASKAFAVPVDEKEEAINEVLPGANCGGCGFSGCAALAAAIARGDAPVNACVVGQQPVADQIAAIMGTTAGAAEKKVAFVRCAGDCDKTTENYVYSGPKKCANVRFAPAGGPKSCAFGCTGFGDCVAACQFDAMHIVRGIAQVDIDKCTDCKKCMAACPKGLIIEVPYKAVSHIGCVNPGKGKPVMSNCKIGCISCQKCMRNCPAQAITMDPGYPVIDYAKCTNCGKCRDDCPRHCIV